MDLGTWILIGLIVGVIATGWQPSLSLKRLILSMITGAIGSVSSGVVGYVFYDTALNGFSISIFTMSLSITSLIIIGRRKLRQLIVHYRFLHPKIFLLPDGKTDFTESNVFAFGTH